MKKTLATIILVGASAFYVFSRSGSGATPTAFGATPGAAGAGTITISPAAQTGSPTTTTAPSSSSGSTPPPVAQGKFKDGSYIGSVADAYYGSVEVKATVKGGALSNVSFLQFPNGHQTSVYINEQAMPMLTQEAISAQNANVNIISGATDTSLAFQQSLATALSKAHS